MSCTLKSSFFYKIDLNFVFTGYTFGSSSSPTFTIGGTNVTVVVTNTIMADSTATATNTNTNDNTLTANGRRMMARLFQELAVNAMHFLNLTYPT